MLFGVLAIREWPILINHLEKAGFVNRGGQGSQRNYLHESGIALIHSGKPGEDVKPYQEKLLRQKLKEV